MIQTNFIHKTPSAEILIKVKMKGIKASELIRYENPGIIKELCSVCPTYGKKWSCPPHSPGFSNYAPGGPGGYAHALLVLFQCDLEQFRYAKTEYIKIKAADSILKSRMDRFMRRLESVPGSIMLSNGTCRLCRPCSGKTGEPCRKPDRMRYSMESLGLDVGRITSDFFGHPLLWYRNGMAPEYLTAVACLLMKEPINETDASLMIFS